MKKLLLFCMFCLPFLAVQAQGFWLHGRITDETQQGLAYVSIGIAGTSTGTVSRPDGSFQLWLPEETKPTDTLRVSHIGFENVNRLVKETVGKTPEKVTIVLKPATVPLAEVKIKAGKKKLKTFGSKRENTLISTNFAIGEQPFQNLGAAMGKRFNLKGKPHYLKQLNLFVAYNTFDTVVFRLQVFKLENGKPTENLLRENIYFPLVKHRKGWASFNLEPYNLVSDEKILVSLEWVGHSKKGKYLGVPLAMPMPGAVHYYKFGSQNRWKVYQTMSTSMNLVTETSD